MKTLVVKYTPRTGSNTEKLLNVFLESIKDRSEIDLIDLVQENPDLMLSDSLNAYVKRNKFDRELSDIDLKAMKKMDDFTSRVIAADVIVFAYPIYNYNLPGLVKLFIDNITQEHKLIEYTDYGIEGLIKDKKGLVINTSGGTQKESPRDFSTPYMKFMFKYWGIEDVEILGAYGIKFTGLTVEKVESFKSELGEVLERWY